LTALLALSCGPDSPEADDAGPDAETPADPDDGGPDLGPEEEAEPWLRFDRVPLEGEPAGLTGMAFLPDRPDEFLVTTRGGELLHYRLGAEGAEQLGALEVPDVHVDLDCGLISLTFAPDFAESRHLFLGQCFSRTASGIVRAEWRPEDADPAAVFADTRVRVLEVGDEDARHPWHNVGSLGFDGEGNLWALFGDKTRYDPAQDPSNLLGTVVRIRVDAKGVAHPAEGNPHETDDTFHPFVWAYGFRSPWRGAMDRAGNLYVGDVGEGRVEEVSRVERGGNHGWNVVEGPCVDDEACEGMVDPLVHWDRSTRHAYLTEDPLADGIDRARVAHVGLVYDGAEDDPYDDFLDDTLLYGDACVGFLRGLSVGDEHADGADRDLGHLVGATGWGVGPEGVLYAVSFGRCTTNRDARYPAGGLWRARLGTKPARAHRPARFPELLSAWGIFPDAPALWNSPADFQFYEPRYPLWTNGAGKLRHVLLPEGREPETVGTERIWPVGTVFFKTFLFDTVPVETRVLRVAEDGLRYAVYRWNDEGTDAELLDIAEATPVDVEVDGEPFVHEIPSRDDCRTCHAVGERRILGHTPLQLEEIAIDAPAETAEIIGWAQGNCVHCHDGSGDTGTSFSMRPAAFLANTIGQPTEGSAAGAGIRVVPGDPDGSALVRAFSRVDENFPAMPPLGVQRRDDVALARLRAWIADYSEPTDAGVGGLDAGVFDAGTGGMDAGVPADAGEPDGGELDDD